MRRPSKLGGRVSHNRQVPLVTDERIRAKSTVPSGRGNCAPSTTPMSAMFISAVADSAQRAHRSGTDTRTMEAVPVASLSIVVKAPF
jgi:hypothetical protein